MRIIGFNFSKIVAERPTSGFSSNPELSTNIEFINIEKEDTDLANDNSEALKASFKFSVTYNEKGKKDSQKGEVSLTGFIILIATKEEATEVLNIWKKKELSNSLRIPIFNFILKKCSVKAMELEEELNLPLHVPMPQIKFNNPEQKTKK